MINLKRGTFQVPGKPEETIQEWKVVFCTMEGAFETLNEAQQSCEKTGQSFETIMPLPAAFGSNSFEVCLKQTMLLNDSEIKEP